VIVNTKIQGSLQEDGFVKIPSFLTEEDIKKSLHIIMNRKGEIDHKHNWVKIKFPVRIVSLLIKLAKFQFNIILQSLYLRRLNEKLKCNLIINNLMPEKKLNLIDIDLNYSPVTSIPIADWHADSLYLLGGSKNVIYKFFIYLTPTKKKSGSLAFIKKSQKINTLITDLMKSNQLPTKKLYSIKDYYEYLSILDVKNILIKKISLEEFNYVFDLISKIYKNPQTDDYDIECNSGDCILFNEIGIHRGGINKIQERFVLRFLYR
jgi:hypothetical protein